MCVLYEYLRSGKKNKKKTLILLKNKEKKKGKEFIKFRDAKKCKRQRTFIKKKTTAKSKHNEKYHKKINYLSQIARNTQSVKSLVYKRTNSEQRV